MDYTLGKVYKNWEKLITMAIIILMSSLPQKKIIKMELEL